MGYDHGLKIIVGTVENYIHPKSKLRPFGVHVVQ